MLPWKWKKTLNMPTAHLTFSSCHYSCVRFPATAYSFFLQSCTSSCTTPISSSPLFLMFSFNSFAFLLTLSPFVSTTTFLITFANSSPSSLPFKSLCTSTLKRIKYEIRPGEPNRPIGEPNRPMSTSPKRVEPILCLGPWQNEGPDLPTTFQKTWSTRMKLALQVWNLVYKDEACSRRMKLGL